MLSTKPDKKQQSRQRNMAELIMSKVFMLCAFVSIAALLLIAVFLFSSGFPAFGEIGLFNFLWGTRWTPLDAQAYFGIRPMIVGTLITTTGAMILGVPIGIFTAIFLAYMCPKPAYVFLKPAVNLLAGIPSVVYGFFGMMVIVPIVRSMSFAIAGFGAGFSLLSAALLLSIMILPTIIAISESAIKAVSRDYYQGALALGASHVRSVFSVVVPAAKSGIFASVILGIGRAVGETMAVVMVAGNQAAMPLSPLLPYGLMSGGRTLTANIVIEMGYAQAGIHRNAIIATGIVLFVFILLINVVFNIINRRRG